MLVNQGSPLVVPLLVCGFLPRETKAYQVLVPDDDPDAPALFNRRRWYYTWGDSDLDRVLDVHGDRDDDTAASRPQNPLVTSAS